MRLQAWFISTLGTLAALALGLAATSTPARAADQALIDAAKKEGQGIFRDADYIPVDPDVPPKDPSLRPDDSKFRAIYFMPEVLVDSIPKWAKVASDLFRCDCREPLSLL